MNEKAILLYKEAAEFAYKVCKDEGRTGGPTDHIWNTLSTGKFAELIVRECISIDFMKAPVALTDLQDLGVCVAIKKHFGVKE